eukprot:761918-Hanusia_phi.AAC.3
MEDGGWEKEESVGGARWRGGVKDESREEEGRRQRGKGRGEGKEGAREETKKGGKGNMVIDSRRRVFKGRGRDKIAVREEEGSRGGGRSVELRVIPVLQVHRSHPRGNQRLRRACAGGLNLRTRRGRGKKVCSSSSSKEQTWSPR